MNTSARILLIVLMLTFGMATLSHAAVDDNDKPIFSLTPYVGAGLWSNDAALDNSFMFGGRGAFHFSRSLSLEGTYGRSTADRSADGVSVDLDHYGADLVWDLLPDARFVPYLAAGWAQLDYNADGAVSTEVLNGAEIGIGLKTRLGGDNANYRALRVDLRDVISNLTPAFANDNSSTHNFIATVGLQFAFGKSSHDTDNDGVRDRDDHCTDTPRGALIDASGCPTDADGDGVFDGLDKCDGTPSGAVVDAQGCPVDSDRDGVFDGLDQCADTPRGAVVDGRGCPVDSDGDGVFDGLDKCPGTDANLQVDQSGCPIAVTETEVQLLDTGSITTNSIVFASSSADLDLERSKILAEIGETLSRWPGLRMEIIGHTDNTGSASFNQKLSLKRAQSVLEYLRVNYPTIDTSLYTATGMGEDAPIADNSTVEGRQANRRVEFKVLNADELKREIEHRKLLER